MQSDSQRRATAKWQAENMTNVAARVRRELAEEFKAAAKEDGTTPNELLRGWIGEYINREVTTMTTEQIQALAVIFAICRKATNTRSQSDIDNAQRFPIKWATIMVRKSTRWARRRKISTAISPNSTAKLTSRPLPTTLTNASRSSSKAFGASRILKR